MVVRRGGLAAALLGLAACSDPAASDSAGPDTAGPGLEGLIPASRNAHAPIGGCELAPAAPDTARCSGPDSSGWSNRPRPPDAGPCPAPPKHGCTIPVLGRLSDTSVYVDCPGYVVLNRSDWTIEMNDRFIGCVATGELSSCPSEAWMLSTRAEVPNYETHYLDTTVTSRETCQLYNASCDVQFANINGAGGVECDEED